VAVDCGIVVNARDLLSPTGPMLAALKATVPADAPIVAVIGGAPAPLREAWTKQHGDRVRFHFEDRFLSQPEARNIGLRAVGTPLAVVMDNDNFPRPGWFEALLRCKQETGAMLVVPLLLERPRRIHCAGCDLYITQEEGKSYGHKVLRYNGMPYAESANIPRRETEYGEMHTMLLEVKPTLEHGAFDEKILEVGEVDSGLVWRRRAGGTLWCEPSAVVHFVEDAPIRAADIRFYAWRWNMRNVLEGYRHFEAKWGFDISEHGEFRHFLFIRNARLGLLPRALPSGVTLKISRGLYKATWKLRRLLRLPDEIWDGVKKRAYGYESWPTLEASVRNQRSSGHPDLK